MRLGLQMPFQRVTIWNSFLDALTFDEKAFRYVPSSVFFATELTLVRLYSCVDGTMMTCQIMFATKRRPCKPKDFFITKYTFTQQKNAYHRDGIQTTWLDHLNVCSRGTSRTVVW